MPNQLQDYLNYVEADKQRKEEEDSLLEYNNFLQDETPQPEERTVTGYDEIISTNQPSSYSPNVSTSGKNTLTQRENDPKFAKIAKRLLESIGENDENLSELKVSKNEIIENVAEKILTQEKSVGVTDENNQMVGIVHPSKIIHTVFGGRKK